MIRGMSKTISAGQKVRILGRGPYSTFTVVTVRMDGQIEVSGETGNEIVPRSFVVSKDGASSGK